MKKVLYILVCLIVTSMASANVTYQSPEDGAMYLAVERSSSDNDLVFTLDQSYAAIDVQLGLQGDPNLTDFPECKIKHITSAAAGQYTVTLNTELTSDLDNNTRYFWKVLAYEPNSMGTLEVTVDGPVWDFKTIPTGPYVSPVIPEVSTVYEGEDVEFTVVSVGIDTFQWYKTGDPDIMLSDSDPNYSGVTTDTLTVAAANVADEGTYYCIGTVTATSTDITSEAPGELQTKRLVHYFPFNTADLSGDITPDVVGGYRAQLIGGASIVVADVNEIFGDYLKLDNPGGEEEDTQYADILDPNIVNYQEVTITTWFHLFSFDRKSAVWSFGSLVNDDYLFFTPFIREDLTEYDGLDQCRFDSKDGTVKSIEGAYEMNRYQWYFVTVTISDGVGKLYIDGKYLGKYDEEDDDEEADEEGGMYSPATLSQELAQIGNHVEVEAGTQPAFNGLIDELKIYNYAMDNEQVAQEYLAVKTDVEYVCDAQNYDLDGWDYDGDCQVELDDLAVILSRWMDDYQLEIN